MINTTTLPKWSSDIGVGMNGIILTDDIDSLMSYYLLKQKFPNLSIVGFYNFDTFYSVDGIDLNTSIWIDCDMMKPNTKSIGNHRISEYKDNNINMNMFLDERRKQDYKYKFPFSTAMTVLYLFFDKEEIDSMSDDILKFIIAIDSAFLGYYKNNAKWRPFHEYWLKELKLDRVHEILRNSTVDEFYQIQKYYNLENKITYSDGLKTEIDTFSILFELEIDLDILIESIKLPNKEKFKKSYVTKSELLKVTQSKIVSMAETFNGKFAITCLI